MTSILLTDTLNLINIYMTLPYASNRVKSKYSDPTFDMTSILLTDTLNLINMCKKSCKRIKHFNVGLISRWVVLKPSLIKQNILEHYILFELWHQARCSFQWVFWLTKTVEDQNFLATVNLF